MQLSHSPPKHASQGVFLVNIVSGKSTVLSKFLSNLCKTRFFTHCHPVQALRFPIFYLGCVINSLSEKDEMANGISRARISAFMFIR